MTRRCGIYAIRCKLSSQVYVGSSLDIQQRWKAHRAALAKGKASGRLQDVWNKFGRDNFTFEVIEGCTRDKLAEREAYWIKEYGCLGPGGMNLSPNRRGAEPASRRQSPGRPKKARPIYPKGVPEPPGCDCCPDGIAVRTTPGTQEYDRWAFWVENFGRIRPLNASRKWRPIA